MKVTSITVYNIELTLEHLYWLSELGIAPELILE